MNRAEKETLEIKNEKMQAILEQRDIEDRLRDRERDFHDREMQLKANSANELKDLTISHQKEIQKLRTKLKFTELELMEERHGHEEHVKLTEQSLSQINIEMDNLRMQQQTTDSLRDSRGSSSIQPLSSVNNQVLKAAKNHHFQSIAPTASIHISGVATQSAQPINGERQSQSATQRYQSYA